MNLRSQEEENITFSSSYGQLVRELSGEVLSPDLGSISSLVIISTSYETAILGRGGLWPDAALVSPMDHCLLAAGEGEWST